MLEQLTIDQTILDAAREVFETMIFMDIETSSDASPIVEGATLLGSITFRGALDGCLTICLSETAARSVAGNMLGIDNEGEIDEVAVADAIGEVANMTMGSIKHRIQNVYPDIHVSIPTVIAGKQLYPKPGPDFSRSMIAAMLNETYPITFTLFFKQTNLS
jgi:CheY-specific phosphatase CheX